MIDFDKFELDNGLKVMVHRDASTPIVAVNLLYDVGAKDEDPNRTGFAHLFEHLMFGGSVNIPNYDTPLQQVGGDNNAFTTNDITNYYSTLPLSNLETAFWLESDRMLSLDFSEQSLSVQRQVVVEEFKQRYLNQPYGDVWLLLRPLAYQQHPYQWATIGKEIAHIEEATLEDVKQFFFKHYNPSNAILSICGNVALDEVKRLAEKWFGPIDRKTKYIRQLPREPRQTTPRTLTVERDVPFDAIYKVYHMCSRKDRNYYVADLLSDILSRGNSSRLHNALVKQARLFSEVNAYITGDMEEGLFVVTGKLTPGTTMEEAEAAIEAQLMQLQTTLVEEEELQKVVNKVESTLLFSEMSVLNKAMTLAHFELLGGAEKCNEEIQNYQQITSVEMMEYARVLWDKNNSSTLYYKAK